MAADLERTVSEVTDERDRFGAVLEGISDAVLALDEHGRITLANRAALAMLRCSFDPQGRSAMDLVRAPAFRELLTSAAEGVAQTREIDLPEDPPRWILTRATPLRVPGLVIVMSDITELRRLEGVRRDFVANVSHELRTPVSIVRASSEALLDGALADADRARSFVESIHRNSERLSLLLADLLDLARIEAGQRALDRASAAASADR